MRSYQVDELFTRLIIAMGENPHREGLQDTPKRAAKAWEYWTSGYDQRVQSVLKTFADGAEGFDELVFQGNIPLYSHCEHHLAPFFGVAHIGYVPNGRCIVGLSKLKRVVDVFAHRLQTQERLTVQIADALETGLQPRAVGVVVTCRHLCMESRGIQTAGTETTTSAIRGAFREKDAARAEFMAFVAQADGRRPK